jgi:hypothetical protein
MTEDEFQRKYHDYQTFDQAEAEAEAETVNRQVDGFEVVAVKLPPLGWCLMLKSAADVLKQMSI